MGLTRRWDAVLTALAVLAVLEAGLFLRRKKTGRSWMIGLLPVFAVMGFARAHSVRNACERELGLGLAGEAVAVEGTVQSVTSGETGWSLALEKCAVRTDEADHMLMGLLVYWDENECPVPGSRILVSGTVREIAGARNPGEFDYSMYYRAKKQNYRMFAEHISVVREPERGVGRYRELLYGISVKAGEILDRTAPESDAGIYRAVLLGEKAALDTEVRELYQAAGISHLLAISGLHLSLFGAAAYGAARKLGAGYGTAGVLGGGLLCSYAVMTGASSSVVRALVMMLLGYGSAWLGRTYDLLSALGAAALVLLWDSPYQITQAGVQLSFGAIVGIGAVGPRLMERVGRHRKEMALHIDIEGAGIMRCMKEAFLGSLGLQLTTLPILTYHFFQLPVYGIFVNLAVVPLMGIVLASGMAGVLLGSVNLTAGRFAMGSGHAVLRLYEAICRCCSRLPGNTLVTGRPELWQIVVYYICFMVLLMLLNWPGGLKRRRLFVLAAAAGMLLVLRVLPVRGLQAVFLDVGQGDGIVLRTKGRVVLVDGGSTDRSELGRYCLEPYLKSTGETRIDLAVVTHGDADHISGLSYLLKESEEITVDCLALPEPGKGQKVYEELKTAAEAKGGTVVWMKRGDTAKVGELRLTCLYPDGAGPPGVVNTYTADSEEDRNEHSVVLKADYGDFHMLLTGDMTSQGEEAVLEDPWAAGYIGNTQVLKIAHHGSKFSTGEPWINSVGPRWAVISYGEGNRYGHPHPETLERLRECGAALYETGKSGTITLHTDGEELTWSTWR